MLSEWALLSKKVWLGLRQDRAPGGGVGLIAVTIGRTVVITLRHVVCLNCPILTQMMADELNFFWSETQNDIAEADADFIPAPGQLE